METLPYLECLNLIICFNPTNHVQTTCKVYIEPNIYRVTNVMQHEMGLLLSIRVCSKGGQLEAFQPQGSSSVAKPARSKHLTKLSFIAVMLSDDGQGMRK